MNSTEGEVLSQIVKDNSSESSNWFPNLTDKIIISVVFGSVILVGIVGNLLVITLIMVVKKLHSVVNLCLTSLAVVDLVVLIFLPIIPWNILHGMDDSLLGRNFCIFIQSIDRGAIACSVLIFLLIGVERYTVLVHPLKSIGLWTYKKVGLLLILIWLIAIGISVPYGYVSRYNTYEFNNKTVIYCESHKVSWIDDYETALYGLTVFLPIPVLIVLYGKMIIALKTQVPQNYTQGTSGSATKKSRLRVIIMLSVLVTIFIVCMLPLKIYQLLETYTSDLVKSLDNRSRFALLWLFRVLLYMNHGSNPIVYFLMSDNFRDGFKAVFCKKCGQQGSSVVTSNKGPTLKQNTGST